MEGSPRAKELMLAKDQWVSLLKDGIDKDRWGHVVEAEDAYDNLLSNLSAQLPVLAEFMNAAEQSFASSLEQNIRLRIRALRAINDKAGCSLEDLVAVQADLKDFCVPITSGAPPQPRRESFARSRNPSHSELPLRSSSTPRSSSNADLIGAAFGSANGRSVPPTSPSGGRSRSIPPSIASAAARSRTSSLRIDPDLGDIEPREISADPLSRKLEPGIQIQELPSARSQRALSSISFQANGPPSTGKTPTAATQFASALSPASAAASPSANGASLSLSSLTLSQRSRPSSASNTKTVSPSSTSANAGTSTPPLAPKSGTPPLSPSLSPARKPDQPVRLFIRVDKIGIKDATDYTETIISMNLVRNKRNPEVLEIRQTKPQISASGQTIVYNDTVSFETPLSELVDCSLFFEFQHYKKDKKKWSTRCWSFCDYSELMRCKTNSGLLVLELYQKPADFRKANLRLFTEKKLFLHVEAHFTIDF